MTAERPGAALRVYQLALVLALGWLIGRLPQWSASLGDERGRIEQALGVEYAADRPAPASGGRSPADEAAVARFEAADETALLVSHVAAEVAQQTVRRLLEAGWAPPGARVPGPALGGSAPAGRPIIVAPPGWTASRGPERAPPEQRLRIVHETAAPGWSLAAEPGSNIVARAPREERRRPDTGPAAEAGGSPDRPAAGGAPDRLAFEEASAGYAALRRGDRREGVRRLSAALARDPGAPQAAQWQADLRRLTRRWSGAAWVVVREGLAADPLAATPVLGASQTGARLTFTPRPLDQRPLSVVARLSAGGTPEGRIDNATAEAALGLAWQPVAGVPLAVEAERRFALGVLGRDDWAARVAGGFAAQHRLAGRAWRVDGWAEAGGVGLDPTDWYGGLQLRGGTHVLTLGQTRIDGGGGLWAAGQSAGRGQDPITRFDLGPSARFRVGQWPVMAQLDYRLAVAGSARPGSGPVITISTDF